MEVKGNRMELVKIDQLKTDLSSIKKFDPNKYSQLKKSIQQYGQLRPIIVSKDLTVLDGYLLLKGLKELLYKEVFIKKTKIDNYFEFRLAYNSLNFDINQIQFLAELKDLEVNRDTHIFPYTDDEIQAYKNLTIFDWDQYKNKVRSKALF